MNGRILATFFLLNEKQQDLAEQGRNEINFRYGSGPYRMRSEAIPESAVAYAEPSLRQMIDDCGLKIRGEVHYGTWSGRAEGLSFQDIVILQHKSTE